LLRHLFDYRFRRPADIARIAFPCAGAQRIWEIHVEAGYRNNYAIRLCSELRLLGLSEEETSQKMTEWNEKNRIELPPAELKSVVRSAYQHPFPYRYGCRDQILRGFCPLADDKSCRRYVTDRTKPRRSAKQS
jgi:primase-like protein